MKLSVTHTSALVSEVTQVFSDWLSQRVRLYSGKPYAEFEWIVGSIPIDDDFVRASPHSFFVELGMAWPVLRPCRLCCICPTFAW